MSLTLSALSTEYVRVRVAVTKVGVAADPTIDVVQMAFTAIGVNPSSGDWKAASWETTPDTQYIARCLVGPTGTVALAAGRYNVWVKVTDAPEVPIINAGLIVVT